MGKDKITECIPVCLCVYRLSKELQQKDKVIESLQAKLNQRQPRSDTPCSSHALSDTTDQSDRISFVSDDQGSTNEDLELCSDIDAASEYGQEDRRASPRASTGAVNNRHTHAHGHTPIHISNACPVVHNLTVFFSFIISQIPTVTVCPCHATPPPLHPTLHPTDTSPPSAVSACSRQRTHRLRQVGRQTGRERRSGSDCIIQHIVIIVIVSTFCTLSCPDIVKCFLPSFLIPLPVPPLFLYPCRLFISIFTCISPPYLQASTVGQCPVPSPPLPSPNPSLSTTQTSPLREPLCSLTPTRAPCDPITMAAGPWASPWQRFTGSCRCYRDSWEKLRVRHSAPVCL